MYGRCALSFALLAACNGGLDEVEEVEPDANCVEWTEAADACLAQAGEPAAYVAGVDCDTDPERTQLHVCMVTAWAAADCTSPTTVDETEAGPAYACTQ